MASQSYPIPGEAGASPGEVLPQGEIQPAYDAYDSPWRVVGASVQGLSHTKQGLPCQDAQASRTLVVAGLPVVMIAVADGAGSAENSDLGAQLAVETALDALESSLTSDSIPDTQEELLRLAFEQSRQALVDRADLDELPLRSLAATLTLAIGISTQSAGFLAVGQIGDGAVVALMDDEDLVIVTHPQRGEYANETVFLTGEEAIEQVKYEVISRPVKGLAVMSDGLLRLALRLPLNEPHEPFFKPLFAFAMAAKDAEEASRQLAGFLASERVSARTDDDKSLVLAVRVS
ncbi:MAG: protein phosphatase 2C domain-containing protein [Chloroflexota bacterium]|nr:MAG: protein phosphatase 2C domain-containing protein [Chloroflexota bacterium]